MKNFLWVIGAASVGMLVGTGVGQHYAPQATVFGPTEAALLRQAMPQCETKNIVRRTEDKDQSIYISCNKTGKVDLVLKLGNAAYRKAILDSEDAVRVLNGIHTQETLYFWNIVRCPDDKWDFGEIKEEKGELRAYSCGEVIPKNSDYFPDLYIFRGSPEAKEFQKKFDQLANQVVPREPRKPVDPH